MIRSAAGAGRRGRPARPELLPPLASMVVVESWCVTCSTLAATPDKATVVCRLFAHSAAQPPQRANSAGNANSPAL